MLLLLYRRPIGAARAGQYDPEADAFRTLARSFDVDAVTSDDAGMIGVTGDAVALAAFLVEVRALGIDTDRITVTRGEEDTLVEARFRAALGDGETRLRSRRDRAGNGTENGAVGIVSGTVRVRGMLARA
jgi:hypothetical protein